MALRQEVIDFYRNQITQEEQVILDLLNLNVVSENNSCDLGEILKQIIINPKDDDRGRLIVDFPVRIVNVKKPFPNPLKPIELDISIQNIVFRESFKVNAEYEMWNKIKIIRLLIRNTIFESAYISHSSIEQLDCQSSEFTFLSLSNSTFTYLIIGSSKIARSDFYKIKATHFFIRYTNFQNKFQCLGSILLNVGIHECTFEDECLFYKESNKKNAGICELFGVNKEGFVNNTFKKKVIFTGCKLDNVNFEKTEFQDIVDFKGSTLTNCNFTKTRFLGEADFKRAKFYGKNTFEYTQFNGRGAFGGAYFEKDPVFNKLILGTDSQMYFSELNKYLDTNENLKPINKFTFTNTIINGRIDFDDNNITILDMQGSVVAGTLSRVLFNPLCANWETATLLKNEEMKRNNLIKALDYKAEEKELYKKYLKTQKNTCRNKLEQFSLFLSWLSNDHGQSWGRGIIFTFIVWIGCFTLFYISLLGMGNITMLYYEIFNQDLNFNNYVSLMIEYLSPTDYKMLSDYVKNTPSEIVSWFIKVLGIFFYLLGKALVPYGVFEVIQAFRKYNKID